MKEAHPTWSLAVFSVCRNTTHRTFEFCDWSESEVDHFLVIGMSPNVIPKYPGEDGRPTSRKELAGFYAYGFAAEVCIHMISVSLELFF